MDEPEGALQNGARAFRMLVSKYCVEDVGVVAEDEDST